MKPRQRRRWQDLSLRQRRSLVIGGLAELIFTVLALWDLRERPAAQVKGPKLFWALFAFVQPVGPLVYLLFGRRASRESVAGATGVPVAA